MLLLTFLVAFQKRVLAKLRNYRVPHRLVHAKNGKPLPFAKRYRFLTEPFD